MFYLIKFDCKVSIFLCKIIYLIKSTKVMIRLLIILTVVNIGFAVDNGLGITPQMGWNSWNHFNCNINETVIKQTTDKIVQLGLDKKGYVYVNIDDCWQIARDSATKVIIQDKKKFPSGMDALSKYIHSKGLKFGLYSDAGNQTCQGRPGSYGFQKTDALTYAKWEVDYLKYDNCHAPNISAKLRYYAMGKALNQSGRPIFYSICNWGQQKVWQWGANIGNSWRTTGDIANNWDSFIRNLQLQVGLQKYAQIGGWNDPDMLEVGNGKLTQSESLAHFSLWCLLKAPLLIGCDLNNISKESLEILSNEELISINQDSLGVQGKRIKSEKGLKGQKQVWGGPLSNNRYAVIFFNQGTVETQISVSIKNQLKLNYEYYSQRDPVRHKDIGNFTKDVLAETVCAHGVEVRILNLNKNNNLLQE